MTALKLYKTYSFIDKDPVIDKLRTIIEDEHKSYAEIAAESGVSITTLLNWFQGDTKRPQYATVSAVVGALGYEYQLVKIGGQKVARFPKRGNK